MPSSTSYRGLNVIIDKVAAYMITNYTVGEFTTRYDAERYALLEASTYNLSDSDLLDGADLFNYTGKSTVAPFLKQIADGSAGRQRTVRDALQSYVLKGIAAEAVDTFMEEGAQE